MLKSGLRCFSPRGSLCAIRQPALELQLIADSDAVESCERQFRQPRPQAIDDARMQHGQPPAVALIEAQGDRVVIGRGQEDAPAALCMCVAFGGLASATIGRLGSEETVELGEVLLQPAATRLRHHAVLR
jgi:hypothetical protein